MKRNLRINSPFFIKLYILMLISVLVPLIIITLINKDISQRAIEKEIQYDNLLMMRETKNLIDTAFLSVEQVCQDILNNQAIRSYISRKNPKETYNDFQEIVDCITAMRKSKDYTPYISNIYIYSFLNDETLDPSQGYPVQRSFKNAQLLQNMISNDEQKLSYSRWVTSESFSVFVDNNGEIYYTYYILSFGKPIAIVAAILEPEVFSTLLQSYYEIGEKNVYISDNEGEILFRTSDYKLDIEGLVLSEDLATAYQGTGSTADKQYLISYYESSKYGWVYYALTPMSRINKPVVAIQRNIYLLFMIMIGIAIVFIYLIAKKTSKPVETLNKFLKGEPLSEIALEKLHNRKDELGFINNKLVNIVDELNKEVEYHEYYFEESKRLKTKISGQIEHLRNQFYARLLNDEVSIDYMERDELKELKIDTDAPYCIIQIEYDHRYKSLINALGAETKSVFKQKVKESIIRNIKSCHICGYISLEASTRTLVCTVDGELDQENFYSHLAVDFQGLKQELDNHYDIKMNMYVGPLVNHISGVKTAYKIIYNLQNYRFVLGLGTLNYNLSEEYSSKLSTHEHWDYTSRLKALIFARDLKGIEAIIEELNSILKDRMVRNSKCIYLYKDIINITLQYLSDIQYSNIGHIDELNEAFIAFKDYFSDCKQVKQWFVQVYSEIFNELNQTDMSVHPVINKAVDMVEEYYTKDIALTDIAEELNITPQYLSRLFKEQLGHSFKEFLTQLRLDKAKMRIRETDDTIKSIALDVGYNSALQFTRVFKKYESITPTQYRQIHKR